MATLKYSRQREAIKSFLAGCKNHPTADTIYTCLRQDYPNISLGTVYRNLSLLEDLGEITRISTGTGAEHYDGNTTPHQHFICTRCQRIYDVMPEDVESVMKVGNSCCPGRVEACHINYYGICDNCLE